MPFRHFSVPLYQGGINWLFFQFSISPRKNSHPVFIFSCYHQRFFDKTSCKSWNDKVGNREVGIGVFFDQDVCRLFGMTPGGEIRGRSKISVLINMHQEASSLDISFPIRFMPKSKGVVVIVYNPGWHASIVEKNKILKSTGRLNLPICTTFDCDGGTNMYIIKRSFGKSWYNYLVPYSFIIIETIVGNRSSDGFLFCVHDAYCTFSAKSTKSI